MKSVKFLVAVLLLLASPVVLAGKPDPGLPNPPLQVWIAGGEVIEADVSGSTVDVSGSTVDVSGSTVDVHVINTPARIPWSYTGNSTTQPGDPYYKNFSFLHYPDDYPGNTGILVVEAFSYSVQLPIGERVSVELTTQGGSPLSSFSVNMPQATGITLNGVDVYRDTASFRAYAGGEGLGYLGDTLSVQFLLTSTAPWTEISFSISGYFVPEDSPSLAP